METNRPTSPGPWRNHAERIFDMAEKVQANQAEAAVCLREMEECGFSLVLVLMSTGPDTEPLREATRLVARAAGVSV